MGVRVLSLILVPAIVLVAPSGAQQKADFTQFMVMGEGLAAGLADFQLREVYQINSFPALMAKQIGVLFPQPLIQSPGIGYVPGFPALPVRIPNTLQTTVRPRLHAVAAAHEGGSSHEVACHLVERRA